MCTIVRAVGWESVRLEALELAVGNPKHILYNHL